jgi:hypothetical protein
MSLMMAGMPNDIAEKLASRQRADDPTGIGGETRVPIERPPQGHGLGATADRLSTHDPVEAAFGKFRRR